MTVKFVEAHEVEVDDLLFGARWRPVARIIFNRVASMRWTFIDERGIIIQSAVIGSRIQIIKEN